MKSVVICASKKFSKEVRQFCKKLERLGVVVYEPNIHDIKEGDVFFHSDFITRIAFKGYTLEHFDWIRKADVVFIYNGKNYVGTSVSMEIGYATALGKPIYALSKNTGDECRDTLIDREVKTPEKLAALLK
ncbi:MAG: hypothetical protein ACD_15C00112G0002 [uncultured bacterium]|nr:MAG: hypothetical protein ACD_15C00112G0002 [uncultured bacterium]